jgi:hypothetical protein
MKAFPTDRLGVIQDTRGISINQAQQDGMDLRDYFAAKALQGLLANPKLSNQILKEGGAFGGWIEKSAYGWADAMMKAREQ